MKKSGWLLIGLMLIATSAMAQVAVENFDYSTGQLTDNGSGANVSGGTWTDFSGTGNFLQVVSGNLSYSGYPSSGIGNMLRINSTTTSAEDAYLGFTALGEGTVTYVSFLLNVDNSTGLAANTSTTGDYFGALLPGNSTSAYVGRLCIRKGADANNYQLGVRTIFQNTEAAWHTVDLIPGTTYLIVLGYSLVPGNTNDVASLWVNPDISGTVPTPNASQVSASATDPTENARFALRQDGSDTPTASIDGIRISDVWSDVGLPVQLASFAAVRVSDDVQLSWSTISEVNNFGFYVERKLEGSSSFTEVPNSFVAGHQTTLEPQSYSFTDNTVTAGVWYYRLRQVDLDGKISYSDPVKVEFTTDVATETPASYSLSQNFPNPFNPSTDIQFTLAKAGTVSLKVYDMLGREVATLANGEYAAGVHHIMFNAINLPSGAYFYALKAGNFSAMKSMLLMK